MADYTFALQGDGTLVVGPGELPAHAFDQFDKETIKSIEFTGPVTAPQDCSELFIYMNNLEEIKGLKNFDTSKATDMFSMFACCESLSSLDVSNFDTSHVTSMYTMFAGCKALRELDVSKFDTSKVNYLCEMFDGCSSLTDLDLSSFDTSHIVNMDPAQRNPLIGEMYNMFNDCPAGEVWQPIIEAGGMKAVQALNAYKIKAQASAIDAAARAAKTAQDRAAAKPQQGKPAR